MIALRIVHSFNTSPKLSAQISMFSVFSLYYSFLRTNVSRAILILCYKFHSRFRIIRCWLVHILFFFYWRAKAQRQSQSFKGVMSQYFKNFFATKVTFKLKETLKYYFDKMEKHHRSINKPKWNEDGQGWRRLTRIINYKCEKFSLNFSRCTNRDVAPLTNSLYNVCTIYTWHNLFPLFETQQI